MLLMCFSIIVADRDEFVPAIDEHVVLQYWKKITCDISDAPVQGIAQLKPPYNNRHVLMSVGSATPTNSLLMQQQEINLSHSFPKV